MQSDRKRILILAVDGFLAYQPSVLSLYDSLEKDFDVSILAYSYFRKFVPVDPHYQVRYVHLPSWKKKIGFGWNKLMHKLVVPAVRTISKEYRYQNGLFKKLLADDAIAELRKLPRPDEIIAVDFVACYAAQQVFPDVILQSLEIYVGDNYKPKCNLDALKAILAPTEERYEYQFGNRKANKFILPNAPTYKEYRLKPVSERKGFIWAGTIDYKFGVQYALDFVQRSADYTLTLKGSFVDGAEQRIRETYKGLIDSGRVTINTQYLSNDEFVEFISGHLIGFCFYDWEVIKQNINYYLAPAGRMYMYFSAGVPQIDCNTPGLQAVTQYHAGIQIADYRQETIQAAVDQIMSNYPAYAQGCTDAAKASSFADNCVPFIEFLKSA